MRTASLSSLAAAALVVLGLAPPTAPADAPPPASAAERAAPSEPAAPSAQSPPASSLTRRLDGILDDPALPTLLWGAYVADAATGEVLYARNADLPLIPASNLKLVTTAAALDVLGPDHRFETALYFDGDESQPDTLRGDLVLVGGGDPSLGSRALRRAEAPRGQASAYGDDPFTAWAEALARQGVRRIEGRLIGIDDALADEPYAPGWDLDHVVRAEWAQPAGGLSYGDNLAVVDVAGTRPGRPATVTVEPEGFAEVQSSLTTRSGRRGYSPFSARRQMGTERIEVAGRVTARYRGAARVPIENPTRFALYHLLDRLREAGIDADLRPIDADDLPDGAKPRLSGAEPLFVHHSPPLWSILREINRKSNNLYAEHVFRALTPRGDTRSAGRRAEAVLQGFGIDTDGFSQRDGSGLSRKDLITPRALGALLAAMSQHEHGPAYQATLAAGGDPSTTLRYRMRGLPVLAKTGSLEHVRALSGYVTAADGRVLAFSLIGNNYTGSSSTITRTQDRLVAALAQTRTDDA